MQTLYEVLGALPSDDAEGLRAAFRKAVKGAHPDIHPDDPDAAMKFRQIVRANEILIDDEQRAAYDHLLNIAQLEQDSASKHAIAAKVHKVASGVIAFACVSVVTVGGYLLYLHVSAAVVPSTNKMEAALRAWGKIAAIRPAVSSETVGKSASIVKPGGAGISISDKLAVASGAAMPAPAAAGVPMVNAGLALDVNSLRIPGAPSSRTGEAGDAPAELEQVIDLDPAASPSYMDHGIAFYRLRKFDRAFADIARARQIQNASHSRSASMMAGKPRVNQVAAVPSAPPLPRPRPSIRDASRDEGFTSAMR
jgi:DnaJ domain